MRLVVSIDGTRVVLAGRIDDSAQLAALADRLPRGEVTIDTDGVVFVNSVGMREWLRLVRVLRARGPVVLERVADVLMTQLNLIPDAAQGVRVASFHAPYTCPACGGEHEPVVDAVAHAEELRRLVAPRLPCPECGSAMELGDFSERYLSIFRG